jgi:hypothetical protein
VRFLPNQETCMKVSARVLRIFVAALGAVILDVWRAPAALLQLLPGTLRR